MTKTYKCGGYASSTGHCGATDCETCYGPGAGREESELRPLDELTDEDYKKGICTDCGFDDDCVKTKDGLICECCYEQRLPADEDDGPDYEPEPDDYDNPAHDYLNF